MRSLSRMLIVALALALVVPVLFIGQAPAADDVKIALVAPLSGRWARQGQLKKMGADMAIQAINSQGGNKARGGDVGGYPGLSHPGDAEEWRGRAGSALSCSTSWRQ